jgi:hypothetical protein
VVSIQTLALPRFVAFVPTQAIPRPVKLMLAQAPAVADTLSVPPVANDQAADLQPLV